MGKVNIIVMFDEGEIAGVKVNNELFFRHENESVVDFYNKRMIPILFNNNIDFVSNYVKDNITIIKEKDYQFGKLDKINVTEEQLKKIVNSSSESELEYDEQLYLSMLYKKIIGDYDYFNQEHFEKAKKIAWYVYCGDSLEKIYGYKEFGEQINEDLSLSVLRKDFGIDKYDNPLFVNDIIRKIVNEIKISKVNIDTYSIIVGNYDNKDWSINNSDKLEFENMKFGMCKDNFFRSSGDARILDITDKPFSSIETLDTDKKVFYDKLYEIYGKDFSSYQDDYWNFYPSTKEVLKEDVTHKIYITVPMEKLYKLNMRLCEVFNSSDVMYNAKFTDKEKRNDGIVIYSDKDNIIKIIELLKQVYKEDPSLFANNNEKGIMSAVNVGVPGVCLAGESNSINSSYNADLAYVVDRALSVSCLKYILKSDDINAKNAFINGFSQILGIMTNQDVKEKLLSNYEEIVSKLLSSLEIVPLKFDNIDVDHRNNILLDKVFGDSINEVSIREEILFVVVKDIIRAASDSKKIINVAEHEIIQNADLYDIHPANVAFKYDSDENKYGKEKLSFI